MRAKVKTQQVRYVKRGGHYKESGMRHVDNAAKREGKAIAIMNIARVHNPHVGKGILWNTSLYRLDVMSAIDLAAQAKRMRRAMSEFFSKYR